MLSGSTRLRFLGSALFWLLWDDIVTFDDEVDLIWPQGITLSSVVFYVNRYGVAAMLTVLQYGPCPSFRSPADY